MLLALEPGRPPIRVESVHPELRGYRVLHVVEGWQAVAPGPYERVKVVLSEQECKQRRLWN